MSEIKILLVDDHFTTIMGLKVLINSMPNMKLVGSAYDGEEGLKLVEELQPDIVLLDIFMPKIDGIQVTEVITKKYPNTKVILFTSSDNKEDIIKGYEAGAMGYIPKTFKPDLLVEAINKVYNGEAYIIGDVAKAVWDYFRRREQGNIMKGEERLNYSELIKKANEFANQQEWQKSKDKYSEALEMVPNGSDYKEQKTILENLIKLTPTELKVLIYAVKESSKSKDIAEKFDMAVKTVSAHRQNIMNKFNVNDFDQIIKDILKNNLIEG